jgi:glycosyltransferase involved in cell wall biosynthesis
MIEARPDISIAVIAYNHERFIGDTFRGIAMQQFSGTIEIVIGDDCSPDRTRELARAFAEQHPNVRLLFHERNLGMVGNWTATIDACQGRYIALCEGDDYWTDPLKLQRQFDLMEQHPEHSLCWHPVDVVEEGVQRAYPYAPGMEVATLEDIVRSHFIPTCSVLFRNGLLQGWPDWIGRVMSMDIALELMLAMHGTAVRIETVMGAYRQHPGGISKTPEHAMLGALRLLFLLRQFNELSGHRCDAVIRERMCEITRYQLKLDTVKQFANWPLRMRLFKYHLYATNANGFRAVRHETYAHLFPELYQKIKRR